MDTEGDIMAYYLFMGIICFILSFVLGSSFPDFPILTFQFALWGVALTVYDGLMEIKEKMK